MTCSQSNLNSTHWTTAVSSNENKLNLKKKKKVFSWIHLGFKGRIECGAHFCEILRHIYSGKIQVECRKLLLIIKLPLEKKSCRRLIVKNVCVRGSRGEVVPGRLRLGKNKNNFLGEFIMVTGNKLRKTGEEETSGGHNPIKT